MTIPKLALSIVFVGILIAGIAQFAFAQAVFVTMPQPHVSVSNQILDFYAGGTTEAYTLRISSQGGTLSLGDSTVMSMMPWGYVTTQWSIGKVYIIFLVNVTETNFGIGFLYLTNSSSPFILRWFDLATDNLNSRTFQGIQHVYNRTVSTGSIELPRLQLPASTVVKSGISALGPQLYLTPDGGVLLNGTRRLNIYPIKNQLFGGPTDNNEVWSLLVDDVGNSYFAIIYFPNSDPSHAIIEHQLRLNDYRRAEGRTLPAGWTKGAFRNNVIVRTPKQNLTVEVDGFPFQTDQYGFVSTSVPKGIATVEVPNDILDSSGAEMKFAGWAKYGTSNPLSVVVNYTLDATAKYAHEYPLVVSSPYGTPQGSGSYVENANATFSVENELQFANGTKQIFSGWAGDSNASAPQAWIIVNSPKVVKALWKAQYAVTISALGLPANASSSVLVGNESVTLTGSIPFVQWVDANQQLQITVQSTQIQGSTYNYVFSELRADNRTLSGALNIAKPVNVFVVYNESPKLTSSISLQVTPSVALAGYPLSITGSIGGLSGETAAVQLLYSTPNTDWQQLASLPVSQNGGFSYTWKADAPGNYSLKVSWSGDSTHSPASQVVGVKVVDSVGIVTGGSDAMTGLLQTGLAAANSVHYLSALISFGAALMTLGSVLSVVFFPGGSPIVGYFIGSILVGFVYVFPISALVLLYRAARARRAPNMIWLTPLLTIWISSLALVVLSPGIGGLQPLTLASEVLLLLSNVLLVPTIAAFQLAKLVA